MFFIQSKYLSKKPLTNIPTIKHNSFLSFTFSMNKTIYMYKNRFDIKKTTYNRWYAMKPNQTKQNHVHLIYMYTEDLALNNWQRLICRKTKENQTKPYIQRFLNKFPKFFSYGQFYWEYTHGTQEPFEVISSSCKALVVPFQQLLEGPMEFLFRHSFFHLLKVWTIGRVRNCLDANLCRIICDKDGIVDWCIVLVEMPLTRLEDCWPLP